MTLCRSTILLHSSSTSFHALLCWVLAVMRSQTLVLNWHLCGVLFSLLRSITAHDLTARLLCRLAHRFRWVLPLFFGVVLFFTLSFIYQFFTWTISRTCNGWTPLCPADVLDWKMINRHSGFSALDFAFGVKGYPLSCVLWNTVRFSMVKCALMGKPMLALPCCNFNQSVIF